MKNSRKKIWMISIAVVFLLAVVLSLPPIWSRVSYHSHRVYGIVKYWLQPPAEAVFVPSTFDDGSVVPSVTAQITADSPASQLTAEPTTLPTASILIDAFTPTPTLNPGLFPTPTFTPASLPSSVLLSGVSGERQDMNNCGPATLSMYLSYYGGWGKDQYTTAAVLKPNLVDVNVMPYEIVDFVNGHTELHALWRYGGDLQTIKALLNAGFPVMIEKSFQPFTLRNDGWLGHYNLVVGYDDERQVFTAHDSYLVSHTPWGSEIPNDLLNSFIGFDFSYSQLEQDWRSFNFVFIVVYPPEKEKNVLNVLGALATEESACRIAYDRAMQETSSLTDVRDKFFAWFNAGTSLVCLQDHITAATAFDTAFGIYPDIPVNDRPFRILWYETGPYPAYYYSERYEDVINLADQTLSHMAEPALEESYYWRALSYYALNDIPQAKADLHTCLEYHPGFAACLAMQEELDELP